MSPKCRPDATISAPSGVTRYTSQTSVAAAPSGAAGTMVAVRASGSAVIAVPSSGGQAAWCAHSTPKVAVACSDDSPLAGSVDEAAAW